MTPITTPLIRLGETLLVKNETVQVSGSFKYRGSYAVASSLPAGSRLVTASTGNHAVALGVAARQCGHTLTVFVPNFVNPRKLQRLGARTAIRRVDGSLQDCVRDAMVFAETVGARYVSSFEDPQSLRGYRTLFDEIDLAALKLDTVYVPTGAGGLLAACVEAWHGRVRIVGVCSTAMPAMKAALAMGRPTPIPDSITAATGLRVNRVGELPFRICSAARPEIATVDDDDLGRAVAALSKVGISAEHAGAAAVAAATRLAGTAGRCLCIATGAA